MDDKGRSTHEVGEAPPPYSSARPSLELDRSQQSERASATRRESGQRRTHQRFVITDPVAFRYLQEDSGTDIIGTPRRLKGYECFVVEQWACSRTHPTFIITTYTGDPSQSVVAQVLSVPTNEEAWSPRLKVWFKALDEYHARRRETEIGTLMVTNLSAFPSGLTCVSIPEGDPKKHKEDFFVNENLKRLGCSGRVGLTLTKPAGATQAKFYQLYRASEKIDLYKAVIELVKLCQVALNLFDLLGPEYADGLLCDVTEKAINDWWVEIGNELYNVEPQDGILGPTTVAALLGTLMGARNRLNTYGAQTSKDVFDIDTTKRAIAYFQKSQRLPRTRRLDRATLQKLHSATAKAATSTGWAVSRAVKSTVAEVGGRGGEMVLETLGAKEKGGIADIETVDIDQFVALVKGERAKWLWHGKLRKGTTGDMFSRLPDGTNGMVFANDDQGGYSWQGQRKDSTVVTTPGVGLSLLDRTSERDRFTAIDEHSQMPKLTKRATATRGGIGKIRNAVGLRSHTRKNLKDDLDDGSPTREEMYDPHNFSKSVKPQFPSDVSMDKLPKSNGTSNQRAPSKEQNVDADAMPAVARTATNQGAEGEFFKDATEPTKPRKAPPMTLEAPFAYNDEVSPARTPTIHSSIDGSTYHDVNLDFLPVDRANENVGKLLRRRHSSVWAERYPRLSNPAKLPRQVSFSAAEESILTWDTSMNELDLGTRPTAADRAKENVKTTYAKQLLVADDAIRVRAQLSYLDNIVGRWADERINSIKALEDVVDEDMQELDDMYYPRLEQYQGLRLESQEVLAGDRARLTEVVKDVEVLGAKLEYEINALRNNVEDVEAGVDEYERQIRALEGIVADLEYRYKRQGNGRFDLLQWLRRSMGWLRKGKMPSMEPSREPTPQARGEG